MENKKERMCMMEMLKSIVLLLVGFILLIKGADFLLKEVLPWQSR